MKININAIKNFLMDSFKGIKVSRLHLGLEV
jgi:hypothetical protein